MASTKIYSTAAYVFPSENDVNGGMSGYGRVAQEVSLAGALRLCGQWASAGIIDGFAPPAVSASKNGFTTSGSAMINGYRVGLTGTGTFTINFPYTNNYCYLCLELVNNKVTETYIEIYDTIVMPSTHGVWCAPLWAVVISGSTVSSVQDWRRQGRMSTGAITCTGANSFSYANYGTQDWTAVVSSNVLTVTFSPAFYAGPLVIECTLAASLANWTSTPSSIYRTISTGYSVVWIAIG